MIKMVLIPPLPPNSQLCTLFTAKPGHLLANHAAVNCPPQLQLACYFLSYLITELFGSVSVRKQCRGSTNSHKLNDNQFTITQD